MTPLEIQIALTYHATANDFRDGDFTAPAVRDTIDRFVKIGFLKLNTKTNPDVHTIYVPTKMLHAYCHKLTTIGLPKQVWTYDEN
jgi:hypothetical protein